MSQNENTPVRATSPAFPSVGSVEAIAIYERALPPEEVTGFFEYKRPPKVKGLRATSWGMENIVDRTAKSWA